MGNQLKPEEIHGKKIIAVAGYDIFGKQVLNVLNKELSDEGILLIGINIKDDDFDFFISNLADSKVEATIFLSEFQKRAGEFYKSGKPMLSAFKKDEKLEFILSDEEKYLDDIEILKIVKGIK